MAAQQNQQVRRQSHSNETAQHPSRFSEIFSKATGYLKDALGVVETVWRAVCERASAAYEVASDGMGALGLARRVTEIPSTLESIGQWMLKTAVDLTRGPAAKGVALACEKSESLIRAKRRENGIDTSVTASLLNLSNHLALFSEAAQAVIKQASPENYVSTLRQVAYAMKDVRDSISEMNAKDLNDIQRTRETIGNAALELITNFHKQKAAELASKLGLKSLVHVNLISPSGEGATEYVFSGAKNGQVPVAVSVTTSTLPKGEMTFNAGLPDGVNVNYKLPIARPNDSGLTALFISAFTHCRDWRNLFGQETEPCNVAISFPNRITWTVQGRDDGSLNAVNDRPLAQRTAATEDADSDVREGIVGAVNLIQYHMVASTSERNT